MSSAARKIEPVLDDPPKEQWHQLSIEDAIQAAHSATGISYEKDDPILSVVAIMNAFGERLKSLMEDERRRFSSQFNNDVAGVNAAIDHKVNGVADTLKTVAENLGNENIQTVVAAVAQHAADSEKNRRLLRSNYKACFVFALCNWLAVAAFYLLLK